MRQQRCPQFRRLVGRQFAEDSIKFQPGAPRLFDCRIVELRQVDNLGAAVHAAGGVGGAVGAGAATGAGGAGAVIGAVIATGAGVHSVVAR